MKHDTQIFERSLNINLSLRYEGNNLNGELINCSESAKINPVRDVCRTLLDTHQGFPFQQHLGGIGWVLAPRGGGGGGGGGCPPLGAPPSPPPHYEGTSL